MRPSELSWATAAATVTSLCWGLFEMGTLPFASLRGAPNNDGSWAEPSLLEAWPSAQLEDAKASEGRISLDSRGISHTDLVQTPSVHVCARVNMP